MARFVIRDQSGNETIHELTGAETRIGRVAPLVDLLLTDRMASRLHAVVRRRPSGFTIVDLNSANGTFVNEERITERNLREGDVVRIGRTTLSFQPSLSAPPAAAVVQTDHPIPAGT